MIIVGMNEAWVTLEILLPVAWSLDFSVLDMASHQVAGYLCQEVTVASRGPLRKVLLGTPQQDTPHYRNTCRQGVLRSSSHLTRQGLSPVGAGRESGGQALPATQERRAAAAQVCGRLITGGCSGKRQPEEEQRGPPWLCLCWSREDSCFRGTLGKSGDPQSMGESPAMKKCR